jgi:hypothetical protein
MYFRILFVVTVASSLLGWSCHNSPTQPAGSTISLKASDVGVLDATLDVHFNTGASHEFRLERGNTVVATGESKTADTLVFIDGLEPAHAYTFRAYRYDGGFALDSTASLAIRTMDTTSNNITWQVTDLAGQGGSSELYDVAVINDTCVYAVGNMFINDSAGSGDGPFAFAVWNGQQWILREVPQPWYSSSVLEELNSIIAFNSSDVWAAGDHSLMHWNGKPWSAAAYFLADQPYSDRAISKMWGSSDTDIYLAGGGGIIYHYTGSGWKLLNTGTTLNFYDVYGVHDSAMNADEVYAVAGNRYVNFDREILKIDADSVISIPTAGVLSDVASVWFKPRSIYYAVGDGVYYTRPWQNWKWQGGYNTIAEDYTESVRGTDRNDIFLTGDFGDLLHYNGASWREYKQITSLGNGRYQSVSMKGNLIVAVGYDDPYAAVAIGRRN